MSLKYHILVSPFAAFLIILFWAAIFGDTIIVRKNSMFEEWLVCMPLYFFSIIAKKWFTKLT